MWNPLIWILLFGICSSSTQAIPIEEKAQRDSYGKLIQAKNTIDGKKIAQTDDGIEFEVPSYASGIVVPEPYNDLLPPLTSSEKLEAGSSDSDIIYIETSVNGISSNNIRDGKSIGSYQKDYTTRISNSNTNLPIIKGKTTVTVEESIEVPQTDLNPPHFENDKQEYSTKDVGDDESKSENIEVPLYDGDIYKGGFGGSSGILGNQESVGTSVIAKDINSGLTDLIPPPSSVSEAPADKYDSDIYRGGFGGSSGILGNQKSIGTYHQQKDVTTDTNSRSSPNSITKKVIHNSHDLLYDGDIYKGRFGGPSEILGHQQSIGTYHKQHDATTDINSRSSPKGITKKVIPNSDDSLYDGDIYKGGFGGPSGVLGHQKSIGTYQQQKDATTNINSRSSSEGITKKLVPNSDDSLYDGDIYKGGFGGPSGVLGHQQSIGTYQQQKDATANINSRSSSEGITKKVVPNSDDSLYDGDIYKGGFGGPSGVLGQQQSIGTYQQQKDATANINSRSSSEGITKKVVPNSDDSLYDGDIYKGGFGGPSGILGNQRTIPTTGRSRPTPATKVTVTNFIPPVKGSTTESIINKSLYDGDIYIGGFGGPSGLLGEQKSQGTFYQNHENNEELNKNKKITNENTTDKIKVNQLQQTTVRPKKKIVSRFEFSSIQKPVSNIKKYDEKKITSTSSNNIEKSRLSSKTVATVPQNKNVDIRLTERPIVISSTTISPPSTDLLPPFEHNDDANHHERDTITTTEKYSYDDDIYKGSFGGPSGILGKQESIGTYHQTKSPEESTTITNDFKMAQNEESTTEIYNAVDSTVKNHAQTIPINVENEGITPPSTDLIPPLTEAITIEETTIAADITTEPIKQTSSLNTDSTTYKTEIEYSTPVLSTKRGITNYDSTATEKSLYEGDIYKGGFGGPAGLLGKQKSIGTYHQENENQENLNVSAIDVTTIPDTKINTEDITTNNRNTKSPLVRNLISDIPAIRFALNNNNNNNDVPPSEVNTKSFLSSPITTPTLSIQSTTPEPPSIYFTPPFFSPKIEKEQTVLIQNENVPTFTEQSPPVLTERFNINNNNGKNDFVSDFVFPKTVQLDNRVHFSPPQQQQQTNLIPNTLNAPGPQQQQFVIPSVQFVDKSKKNSDGSLYDGDIYKGRFGGPAGILGHQQSIGTYHQQKDANTDIKSRVSSEGITKKVVQNSDDSLYDGDIYKGRFGGPAGILGHQQSIGTYHQQKDANTDINSRVSSEDITKKEPSASPTPLLNKFNNNLETIARPPIALNTFGNIQGFNSPIQFLSSSTDGTFYNNKFAGNFGGAPGVLGNQKEPGFGVQPQNVPTQSSFVAAATVVTNNKYNGGFGGPPGVLSPFDNKSN